MYGPSGHLSLSSCIHYFGAAVTGIAGGEILGVGGLACRIRHNATSII
jgi:hypothetical protein